MQSDFVASARVCAHAPRAHSTFARSQVQTACHDGRLANDDLDSGHVIIIFWVFSPISSKIMSTPTVSQGNGQLAGKVAIITGASRGVGAELARVYAREGASVVVNYFRSQEAASVVVSSIKAAGGNAIAHYGDVTSASDMEVNITLLVRRSLDLSPSTYTPSLAPSTYTPSLAFLLVVRPPRRRWRFRLLMPSDGSIFSSTTLWWTISSIQQCPKHLLRQ